MKKGFGTDMGVRLVVAVTDQDWFERLRIARALPEVNFWAPSPSNFRALQPGELFLFKLHAPLNYIVGGGVFAYANVMPCSLAWEAFGEANGTGSLGELRRRIIRYRREAPDERSDFQIGCRILTQPFFLDRENWIPVPESWSKNVVTFKRYTTDSLDGLGLWDAVQTELARTPLMPGLSEPGARFGTPVLLRPRLGQGAFRVLVTDSYERKCAVTGEKTLPALDAAHIRPYAEGGAHEASNGLLFRRDIHSLFDAGYVTVTPDHRFEVSRRIKDEFDNGRDYYALHGGRVRAPLDARRGPDREALNWHNEKRYLG
jgi:putative restriction endonuclease